MKIITKQQLGRIYDQFRANMELDLSGTELSSFNIRRRFNKYLVIRGLKIVEVPFDTLRNVIFVDCSFENIKGDFYLENFIMIRCSFSFCHMCLYLDKGKLYCFKSYYSYFSLFETSNSRMISPKFIQSVIFMRSSHDYLKNSEFKKCKIELNSLDGTKISGFVGKYNTIDIYLYENEARIEKVNFFTSEVYFHIVGFYEEENEPVINDFFNLEFCYVIIYGSNKYIRKLESKLTCVACSVFDAYWSCSEYPVINIGPIGRANNYITYNPIDGNIVYNYNTDEYFKGSLEDFEKFVYKIYKARSKSDKYDMKYYQQCMNAISFFKSEHQRLESSK